MGTIVDIDGGVRFNGAGDVWIEREALDWDRDRLKWSVQEAFDHCSDEPLVNGWCSGVGPFADFGVISIDRYRTLLANYHEHERLKQAAKNAKQQALRRRRAQYQSRRDDLVLALLHAGVPYICAEIGCGVHANLTIDHIKPLSIGGTDGIDNLQFLCRAHNSAKGARHA